MKSLTVVKREALFIKKSDIPKSLVDSLIKKYTFLFFVEKACARCEFLLDKENMPSGEVSDICSNCAAYTGGHKLAASVVVGKNKYLRVPIGDIEALTRFLESKGFNVVFKNKNPHIPVSKAFKFTGTLKPEQLPAVEALKKYRRGTLNSPPRSGKTVMATALACALGLKTIIIASQRDWLVGFLETFIGSKTQKPLTNISRFSIGFAKKLEDFKKFDVCLCTVQTFYSPQGEALLKKISSMFSLAIYDECQTTAAPKYAKIAAQMNVEYSIALSGTPQRKDLKHVLTEKIIGPVVHKVFVERLKPEVKLTKTAFVKSYKGQARWDQIVSSLEKDPKRLKLIAETALQDMARGHLVLIPLTRVTAIKALVLAINKIAGKTVAHPFYGGISKDQRDLTIEKARGYKYKILVGNTKILSTGINIPRASCIYEVAISANRPNCEQRISRILTPWDDKPKPLIRIFLDDMDVRRKCLANEWFGVIKPKFRPDISEKDELAMSAYLKGKTSHQYLGLL